MPWAYFNVSEFVQLIEIKALLVATYCMPLTWNNGPPWRELPGKVFSGCRVSEVVLMECRPCMPGLGQGMLEYWNNGQKRITSVFGSRVLGSIPDQVRDKL